jgi:O-antigen ligase
VNRPFEPRSLVLGTLVIASAVVVWTRVSFHDSALVESRLALIASVVAAFTVGWVATNLRLWALVPLAIVVAGAAVGFPTLIQSAGRGPLSGPFGYVNASGSFLVQAAVAAAALAVRWRGHAVGTVAVVAGLGFVVVTATTESRAAMILAVLAPVAAWAAWRSWGSTATIVALAAAFALALGASIVLGLFYNGTGDGNGGVPASLLSERRLALWSDALSIMGGSPLIGVGDGGFGIASDTARSDVDARWAHNEFLEAGAEWGVPGFLLLAALMAWGFCALLSARQDALTVFGAGALAALGIHACIDYIFHFPAIPVATAALVGACAARRAGLEG